MRIKTSMYIDETVATASDKRATDHKVTKSKIIEHDLENFYLCLEIGRLEVIAIVNEDVKQKIKQSLGSLAGQKGRALFITKGLLPKKSDKEAQEISQNKLSPLGRLALLDSFEEEF